MNARGRLFTLSGIGVLAGTLSIALAVPAYAAGIVYVTELEFGESDTDDEYQPGWHETIDPAASAIEADGLRMAPPGVSSRVLNGLQSDAFLGTGNPAEAQVTSAAALQEQILAASFEVVEGVASFQLPLLWQNVSAEFGVSFTTIRTGALGPGVHSLSDPDMQFAITQPIGSLLVGNHTLQEIIDALIAQTPIPPFAAGDVILLAFGVQADPGVNALVSSVTWQDTQYVFTTTPPTEEPVPPAEPAPPAQPAAPTLPETGFEVGPFAMLAMLAMAAGAGMLILRRRARDA